MKLYTDIDNLAKKNRVDIDYINSSPSISQLLFFIFFFGPHFSVPLGDIGAGGGGGHRNLGRETDEGVR